ncbi:MAG: PHP domain-containing protein [Candidatus Jordarchaeum sp.]|uniref:PHP domain-containing protein n=1 Tax=Candidatus Jordarchaeum sp. TaxID=2823881 RepID=UPI00404A1642
MVLKPDFDLHIHSKWSDGIMTCREAVEYAVSKGIRVLGISDHFSTDPEKNPRIARRLPDYYEEIRSLGEEFGKQISVKASLEVDARTYDFLSEKSIKVLTSQDFDYYLFEYVTDPYSYYPIETRDPVIIISKIKQFKELLSDSCPVGIAHMEVRYLKDDKLHKVINDLAEAELFVELNSSKGNYKHEKFIPIIQREDIKLSIGSDAHIKTRIGDIEYPLKILERYNATNRLIFLKELI